MDNKDAKKVADFVWEELLHLDPEETAGDQHLDWNDFHKWLTDNIV